MREWRWGAGGRREQRRRWGVVIAMDPFLYESRHSLPHGKGSFLELGNGFFSSRCSLRWAECKLHPARPLHSQDQCKLAAARLPRNPFPPHHQFRSWEMLPSRSGTKERIRQGIAYADVAMLSFLFPISHTLYLSAHTDRRNTPAASRWTWT